MRRDDLYVLGDRVWDEATRVTKAKSAEYTRGAEDALANFKRVGVRADVPSAVALEVYAMKHWDGLMAAALGKADFDTLSESPLGRAADMVNYVLLLLGLIAEQMTPAQRERWGMALPSEATKSPEVLKYQGEAFLPTPGYVKAQLEAMDAFLGTPRPDKGVLTNITPPEPAPV